MKSFVFVCMALFIFFPVNSVFAAPSKVLVIHSYHPVFTWVGQCNRGITGAFNDDAVLTFTYLDTKRIPPSDFTARAKEAMDLFNTLEPDLVMIGDDNALRLMGPGISQTGIPVVFFGINNNPRQYFESIPANVGGVLESVLLFPWIRHLKSIFPEARNALVLMDDSATSASIIEVTFKDRKEARVEGLRVGYRIASTWSEWQRAVLESRQYDFITMPAYHAVKDGSGRHIALEHVVQWTSANSPIPVFAYQDYAVGDNGVVGAYVIHGEGHGRLAARIAKEILEGRNVGSIPIRMDRNGVFFFNKKQMERFKITLPGKIEEQAYYRN